MLFSNYDLRRIGEWIAGGKANFRSMAWIQSNSANYVMAKAHPSAILRAPDRGTPRADENVRELFKNRSPGYCTPRPRGQSPQIIRPALFVFRLAARATEKLPLNGHCQ